jgi:bifunctional non-homologous end joining protein LigD
MASSFVLRGDYGPKFSHVIEVSNAGRIVFPEIQRTKGDVVHYYEELSQRIFRHVSDRPLSIKRYPKGLSGSGFFQKNVPAHYPESFGRFEVPRTREASKRHRDEQARGRNVTVYPVIREPEQLAYVANQGALELHVPVTRVAHIQRPDRIVLDLDPKPGALALVRRAAHIVRDSLGELGLETVPVATGSKGYHLVAAIRPEIDWDVIGIALQKFATLLSHDHPEELTTVFRIAERGDRVFVDWLRNQMLATVVAPYSLRARPRAPVAAPLSWDEIETTAPDAFGIDDAARLLDRADSLHDLGEKPADAAPFVAGVDAAFERSGLELEVFDRFRS